MVGGLGGSPTTTRKIGLSPHVLRTVLRPKYRFCNFRAVFGHFAQNVPSRGTSLTQMEILQC